MSRADDKSDGLGSVVADHYNKLYEGGLDRRNDSRIIHMRNFNNWTKSVLINDYADVLRKEGVLRGGGMRVLDLGCGKGGDLNKWNKAGVKSLVCADIAEVSVKQAEERYDTIIRRNRGRIPFEAQFIAADCTKERLKDKFSSDAPFDLVSCQFAFHYCFESYPQAECMLRNASERLREGGYFIGSTPDAFEIVSRVKSASDRKSAGNKVYSVTFQEALDDEKEIPLFGAKYDFHLEGVVDCPEFLVHFPTLEKLAAKFGLTLVAKRSFGDYFEDRKVDGEALLKRMKALEGYGRGAPTAAPADAPEQYSHAEEFMKKAGSNFKEGDAVGTLSKDEWEAINVYLVFAFRKTRSS